MTLPEIIAARKAAEESKPERQSEMTSSFERERDMADTQPSQAAMEAANAIVADIEKSWRPITDRIALALDAFARDAVREAVERCCGVADDHDRRGNVASDIRRAFADVLENQ